MSIYHFTGSLSSFVELAITINEYDLVLIYDCGGLYPEMYYNIELIKSNLIKNRKQYKIIKPKKPILQAFKEYGMPTVTNMWCKDFYFYRLIKKNSQIGINYVGDIIQSKKSYIKYKTKNGLFWIDNGKAIDKVKQLGYKIPSGDKMCFFCPYQSINVFEKIYKNSRELFEKIPITEFKEKIRKNLFKTYYNLYISDITCMCLIDSRKYDKIIFLNTSTYRPEFYDWLKKVFKTIQTELKTKIAIWYTKPFLPKVKYMGNNVLTERTQVSDLRRRLFKTHIIPIREYRYTDFYRIEDIRIISEFNNNFGVEDLTNVNEKIEGIKYLAPLIDYDKEYLEKLYYHKCKKYNIPPLEFKLNYYPYKEEIYKY